MSNEGSSKDSAHHIQHSTCKSMLPPSAMYNMLWKHNDVLQYPNFQKTLPVNEMNMKSARTVQIGDYMYMYMQKHNTQLHHFTCAMKCLSL